MNSYSRTYAAVDLDAVVFNFESMRKNIREDTSMIAVIKADAYGHGAVPVARLLESYSYIWGYVWLQRKKLWNSGKPVFTSRS